MPDPMSEIKWHLPLDSIGKTYRTDTAQKTHERGKSNSNKLIETKCIGEGARFLLLHFTGKPIPSLIQN